MIVDGGTLRRAFGPDVLHFCLLAPCNCDGRRSSGPNEALRPGAVTVLHQKQASNAYHLERRRQDARPYSGADAWVT